MLIDFRSGCDCHNIELSNYYVYKFSGILLKEILSINEVNYQLVTIKCIIFSKEPLDLLNLYALTRCLNGKSVHTDLSIDIFIKNENKMFLVALLLNVI